MKGARRGLALLAASALTACAGIIPPAAERAPEPRVPGDQALPPLPSEPDYETQPTRDYTPPEEPAATALGSGIRRGPDIASLPIADDAARRALHAFRISCPAAIRRDDPSGLTAPAEWVAPCRAAAEWEPGKARDFFGRHFVAVEIAGGEGFATGYYEPEIAASLAPGDEYRWPIHALPEMIEAAAAAPGEPQPRTAMARIVDGRIEPFPDRAAIEAGAIEGTPVLAWARDPVALFFLHIQGSGLLRLADGGAMRVGYAGNNGYDYTSIGALMRERGLLEPGQATSQGIQAWLRAHPEDAREIMHANRRYIFFRASNDPAPRGSLGSYVTPRATVAADPAYVPLGAPVFLDVDQDVADGLWVAQDTGSAIRGANRFDTFWGAGERAHDIAGGMAGRGRAYVFLPRASAERMGL